MSKISGTYTMKIADKHTDDGRDAGTVVTIRITAATTDDAATAADAVGTVLDKLGLAIAPPQQDD